MTPAKALPSSPAYLPAYLIVLTWPVTATGGVNEVAFGVAHALRSLGWRPIIGVATWSPEEQVPEWRGIEIVNLCMRDLSSMNGSVKSGLAFCVAAIRDSFALRRFVKERGVAVINFQFPSLSALIPVVLRTFNLLPASIVLTFQGNDFVDMSQTKGFSRHAWNALLHRSDALTACSGALRQKVMDFLPGTKVTTVHNGVDHTLFTVARRRNPGRPLLLSVAKFEHKKSQDVTLRAFRTLLDEGIEAELALVGATGPELENTRNLILELHLSEHVRMEVDVPHDRIPEVMAQADIFLLPSRIEPFGIVLLEAGMVGLPVVAARVGGIPELLQDGETGLLIEPDDPAALASAVRRLLADRSLAHRLGLAWQQRVMNHWTWTETARGYLQAAGQSPTPQTAERAHHSG